MTVHITKKLHGNFKRAACKAFPSEYLVFLIGDKKGGDLYVDYMWVPPDLAAQSDGWAVIVKQEWLTEAMRYGADKGRIVLGTAHTHVYEHDLYGGASFEPVQSIGDSESWEQHDLVCGIANVLEDEDGKRTCTDIHWWENPPLLCEVKLK